MAMVRNSVGQGENLNGSGRESRNQHLVSNFQVCQNPPKLRKPACAMWKDVHVLFFPYKQGEKTWHTGLKLHSR